MTDRSPSSEKLDSLSTAIVRTLLYVGIFRYPLRANEIWRYLGGVRATEEETRRELERLEQRGMVHSHSGFFWVGSEMGEPDVIRRRKGNQLALDQMEKAHQMARRIASFPWVNAVMVSGSLSKGYMDVESDIDFFIVTEPGRLWIARTLLVLYKRLFLFNRRKYFCVNYFVDNQHLGIEDRNFFTAMETATLLPMVSPKWYHQFRTENAWCDWYLPQFGHRNPVGLPEPRKALWAKWAEWFWKGNWGGKLDDWCMNRTFRRWEKKFPHFSQEVLDQSMRTRKYVSKHHPSNFQDRVLGKLEEGISEFEKKFQVQLNPQESSPDFSKV